MVHHIHGQTASEVGRRWMSWLNARVERFSLAHAKAVIAVSQSAGRYIANSGIAAERVRVLNNGVPTSERLLPRVPPRQIWTLATIALFRPRKGLETLLEALAQLRQENLPVRLRAIGSFETPDYERSARALADRLGLAECVEWAGFRSNVVEELLATDLLIFPSLLAEGLPMVIIEAMAAGTPIIGSRVDGVADAIRDGVDGLLCAPGNSNELAAAIGRVVRAEIDWQDLRSNAWRRQREQFSDRNMARGLAALYREILC